MEQKSKTRRLKAEKDELIELCELLDSVDGNHAIDGVVKYKVQHYDNNNSELGMLKKSGWRVTDNYDLAYYILIGLAREWLVSKGRSLPTPVFEWVGRELVKVLWRLETQSYKFESEIKALIAAIKEVTK